jgi:small subunit ribosomal protein S12
MPTINQLILKKTIRKRLKKRTKVLALNKCPQKRGICVKISIIKPKKPNSAQRKIAKVRLSNKKFVMAYIPGHGHNLQEFSTVLIRAGRVRDLPGMKYKMIRYKLDFTSKERINRAKRRSKFGVKRSIINRL